MYGNSHIVPIRIIGPSSHFEVLLETKINMAGLAV